MSNLETAPLDPNAATLQARDALFARLDKLTEEEGHFEPVGKQHWALFEDVGTTLIVSFISLDQMLEAGDTLSPAHSVARAQGWSHLCLISDGETWFRDPAVYRHFDRLVDDAFFEDFDRVLFYGHGTGGHAACAFSVAAPGAQVLALNPSATQNAADAGWDRRYRAARRLDFASRYGYAPDMLEGAADAVVIHDLTQRESAMHSALFRAPWVKRLSTPLLGDQVEWGLRHMKILPLVIEMAMAGKLTHASFAKLWRKRREFAPYLRALLERSDQARRWGHSLMICRSVTRRLRAPYFQRRLAKLTEDSVN